MTVERHDSTKHPVDCPECQRMLDEFETNSVWEHAQAGVRTSEVKGGSR